MSEDLASITRAAVISVTTLDASTGRILQAAGDATAASTRRFDGPYGLLYDRVINSPIGRRVVGAAIWGSGQSALRHLDTVIDAAFLAAGPGGRVLDVPSGAGTTLRRAAAIGFQGRIVAADLSTRMLARAQHLHHDRLTGLAVTFLLADALALPVPDAIFDAAVSINGLHVLPEPGTFLRELARVVRPGGTLHLTTLISVPDLRSRAALQLARSTGVIPADPPTPAALELMLDAAGWRIATRYGGASLTGLACVRA